MDQRIFHGHRRGQAGFTLIEALIALLVMAFGMLAIAGLQTTLSRSSDVAKQRSEAVRLAQVKMEELRSFDGVAAGTGTYTYTTNVVSNPIGTPEVVNAGTNTSFTRTWNVTRSDGVTPASGGDLEKWINVTVAWADRTGQNQTVTLNSVIARNDPVALKGLIGNQARTKIRYPKGRDINIPYPAVSLAGGKSSAFVPPPSSVVYVFDNVSGTIINSCTAPAASDISSVERVGGGTTVTVTTAAAHKFQTGNRVTIAGVADAAYNGTITVTGVAGNQFTYILPSASGATPLEEGGGTAKLVLQLIEDMNLSSLDCVSANAYLLSGYIRFKTGAADADTDNIVDTIDDTLDLVASGPLKIDVSATGASNGPSAYVCYAERQKVLSASNLQPEDIESAVREGGRVTITTKKAHSFVPGTRIGVEFVKTTSFNNSFIVDTVSSSTKFTYLQPGPDETAILNTGTLASRVSRIQQIVVPDGATVDGYGTLESKFIAYSCVVTPVVVDASRPKEWWGELKLVPTFTLGTTSSTFGVCRYSGDYIADGKTSNHEHPRYYRQVSGALDNQNFLVIAGDKNCPGDVKANPLGADYVNTNTVRHQGGSNPPALSYQCLTKTTPCDSKSPDLEPADPTTPILMF